ncbi:MAG: Gfo/Idh/MocA family oxidoreductase [Verrucomicrobia bacterium]|nr:Gfo/Idh/MocA family oxidoreductase [Verrucomicrobiota bacterium]MBV9673410.1 Gfo/Idh/MocA family oxidoreductase [Verrucomicrobiota bacterium]
MRAILVGCGAMSAEWIRCAQELGVELVALVDLNPVAAQKRAQEFKLEAKQFAEYDKALAETRADALFDCTVPATHKEVSSKAMLAGLHVLEEKPLALNIKDALELVALAEKTGRVHAVLQNRRFNKGIRTLRQMIVQGAIGEVTAVHCDFFIAPHFGGFREQMEHVLLSDMAIHPFDAVRFLTGANAESVFCEEWNPSNSWYQAGSSVTAIFRMTTGARFTYRASWCADGFRTPWDANWRIVGTQGSLLWDGIGEVRGERVTKTGAFFSDVEPVTASIVPESQETRGHYSVMAQFVQATAGGPLPETRSADNVHSLAMVIAAIQSVEDNAKVDVALGTPPDS